MVGDIGDIVGRLVAALPGRWFGGSSPNLTSLLSSIGTSWVWLYGRITYAVQQTRLLTATEEWLDLISSDYFGPTVARKPGEPDGSYRARIQTALLAEAATRYAVSVGLQSITGSLPTIFEPGKCSDTGGYGLTGGGMAYGSVGGWGSLSLPLQCFITVTRPPTSGANGIAGYGTSAGGFGEGSIGYVDLELLPGEVTDQDIQTAISRLMPINAVAWLRII